MQAALPKSSKDLLAGGEQSKVDNTSGEHAGNNHPAPTEQRQSSSQKLGKRRAREWGTPEASPQQAPEAATMQQDSADTKSTMKEPPSMPPDPPFSASGNGLGGATTINEGRRPSRRVSTHEPGNPIQQAGGATAGQEHRERQVQPAESPILTEQEVRAKYYYDTVSRLWVPGATFLDQQLKGQDPPQQILDVQGDGNCQPRAIVATGQSTFLDFRALKAAAGKYLRNNRAKVREHLVAQHLIQLNEGNWEEQLKQHLGTNEGQRAYGDEISLALYAMLLQTEIRVYDALTGQISQVAAPIAEHRATPIGANKILELGYRSHQICPYYDTTFRPTDSRADGHYWAIIPFPGNGGGSG
jgi:hypothetical protein